jgi:hypothetical protein
MKLARRQFSAGLAALLLAGTAARAQIADETVRQAVIGIMDAGNDAHEVAGLRQVPHITVINLRLIAHDRVRREIERLSDFKISAEKNAAGIKRLRKALRANRATRAALAERGIDIGRILAVHIFSDGSLRVFIL